MSIKFLTITSFQTQKMGKTLAENILKSRLGKKAKVLGLAGDLGGGKTTFIRGMAKGLMIKEKILSPTFVILKHFELRTPNFEHFYHIDCYRIQKTKEILDLGFREIVSNPKNIVAIEWADRIKGILPKNTIWLKFDFINEKTRKIVVK